MNLRKIAAGDTVEVDKRREGRPFRATVEEHLGHAVRIAPLDRRISHRTASAREVVRHYRRGEGLPTAAAENHAPRAANPHGRGATPASIRAPRPEGSADVHIQESLL